MPAWTPIIRQCRKWSLDGWRGGLLRTTVLDEEFPAEALARFAAECQANWVVQVRAESPLVDPKLIDDLVDRALTFEPAPPFVYGGIPPGLAGVVYRRDFLEELAEKGLFPGLLCGYRAWEPGLELPEQPFALKVPAAVTKIPVRLLADNRCSLELARRLADAESAEQVAAALSQHPEWLAPELPGEIEIEITSRRSHPSNLRPSAERPDMSLGCFRALVDAYSGHDVGLVTIAGHGDPLLHPDWKSMVHAAAQAGVYGVSLVTNGGGLTLQVVEDLLQSPLDVLCVQLDAHSPRTFARMHRWDGFAQVVSQLERFLDLREQRGGFGPRLVVSMVRCSATLSEMEAFYDHWSTAADGAVIEGHSDFAGQTPTDDVLNLCPPDRRPCRRLNRRMTVLSDGRIVTCSEDYLGMQAAGTFPDTPLKEAWEERFAAWRADHRAADWSRLPLCPHCREWHRP